MDDQDKIRITSDELFDSHVDEELVRKRSVHLSQQVEKVRQSSKFDTRILIKIGIYILGALLISLMIIRSSMKHESPQEQPSVKSKTYKA